MGEQLIAKMVPALAKMNWPKDPHVSEQGRQMFLVGMEKLDGYTGDTKLLSAALHTFETGDSLPYAFTGVAYALVLASQEKDGTFSHRGLEEAKKWLEQAQDAAPDILEINVIEALVYTYDGREDDARLILDYLQKQDPNNFRLLRAEVAYWKRQQDTEQTVYWFNKAAAAADNVPQRLGIRAKLGDYYLEQGMLDEALSVYQEAKHFDNKNAALWHKVSVIYWQQENYEEAEHSNQQALRIQKDYAPAVRMHDSLKKKKAEGSRLGRLFK